MKNFFRAFYSLTLVQLLLTVNVQSVSAIGQGGQSLVSYQHVAYDNLSDAQKTQIKTSRPAELATYADESYILVYRLDTKTSVVGTATSASPSRQTLPRTGSQEFIVYVAAGVSFLALAIYFHKTHKKAVSAILVLVVVGLLNGTSQVSSQSFALLRTSVTKTYDKGAVMTHTPETVAGYTYIGYIYATNQEALETSRVGSAGLPNSSSDTNSSLTTASSTSPSSTVGFSAPVTTNYLDENGNVLSSSTVLEGGQELGISYVVNAQSRIEKDGLIYELVGQADNSAPESGKSSEEAQAVNYNYKPLAGKAVTLNYLDAKGEKLQADTVVKDDGTQVGSAFEVNKPAEIVADGLTYVLTDKDKVVNGKVGEVEQNLTAVYEPKAGKTVIVSYLDPFGNNLQADTVIKADGTQVGTVFELTKPDQIVKDGLTFVLAANQAKEPVFTGKVMEEVQVAELVYFAKPGGSVEANFLDGLGNPLLEVLEIKPTGTQVGTPFQIVKPQELLKNGLTYILDGAEESLPSTGTVTETNQIFNYKYTAQLGGSVTLNYVDQAGNSLRDVAVIVPAGTQVGTPFQVTRPQEITKDGLVYLLRDSEDVITGKVSKDNLSYKATYEAKPGKIVTVNYVDESGNALQAPTEVKAAGTQIGTSFQIDVPAIITKDGLTYVAKNNSTVTGKVTESAQNFEFVYVPQAGGVVTVRTVDTSGTSLQTDTVLKVAGTQVGTSYNVTASNDIVVNNETYELISSDTGAPLSGTVTTDNQTIVLTYRKRSVGKVIIEYWAPGFDAQGRITDQVFSTEVLTTEATKYGDILPIRDPWIGSHNYGLINKYDTWEKRVSGPFGGLRLGSVYKTEPAELLNGFTPFSTPTVTVTETEQVIRYYYRTSGGQPPQ